MLAESERKGKPKDFIARIRVFDEAGAAGVPGQRKNTGG
jgi:hypothetical protein